MGDRARKAGPRRLPVGTRVRYRLPAGGIDAEVIEDRGFILQGGGQVVRIRAVGDTDFPSEFDTPVRLLDVIEPPGRGRAA